MMICAPSDEDECRKLLTTAYEHKGPSAVRYPRGTGTGIAIEQQLEALPIGKGVVRREGKRVAILNFGTLLPAALQAAEALNASVCDMRFVKPLDTELVLEMYNSHDLLVTVEENAVMGGAGSSVGEWLGQQGLRTELLPLGLPDRLIEHGTHQSLLAQVGLDAKGIESQIQQRLQQMASRRPAAS